MSDLIRRQEAIDELWKSEMAFRPSQIDEVMRILCKVPTNDAVPVVRCKDCIYCSKKDCWTESGKVTLSSCWNEKGMFTYVLDNDYCSRGYRRDNNG